MRRLVCLMILAVAFGLLTIHLMFTPDVSLDVATTAHHSNQEIGFNWSELVEAERQGGQEEEEEAGDGAQEQREALLMEDEGRLGREGASEQQHSCEGPYDQAYPNCANKLEVRIRFARRHAHQILNVCVCVCVCVCVFSG